MKSPSAADSAETTDPSPGWSVYGEFVAAELSAQDARKASFEQRGLAVVTTAGALVTLLFGLAALSTKRAAAFELPHPARVWLLAGLGLFFIAAMLALYTNVPRAYEAVNVEDVRQRLREDPPRSVTEAEKDVAFTRLKALDSAKSKNTGKGYALLAALLFEALAVGCVAFAVGHII